MVAANRHIGIQNGRGDTCIGIQHHQRPLFLTGQQPNSDHVPI